MATVNTLNNTFVTTTPAPVGAYVSYKGAIHIIVGFNDDMTQFKILNPIKGNSKLMVSGKNLGSTPYDDAVVVSHKGSLYLRTTKGCIISLTTGRVMAWSYNDGNRVAIMAV